MTKEKKKKKEIQCLLRKGDILSGKAGRFWSRLDRTERQRRSGEKNDYNLEED